MSTIKDVAKKLGVSVSTVSKGLNGAKDISEEMRQLVLETAVEMGYATKHTRRLSKSKVCILVNADYFEIDDVNSFGHEIVIGFKLAAARRNCHVDVIKTRYENRKNQKYDSFLLENGYRGCFILGLSLNDAYTKQLLNTTFPTVSLDNYIPSNKKTAYVGTDNFEGIDIAINELLDHGHENISLLNFDLNSLVGCERSSAFQHSLTKRNISLNNNWMVSWLDLIEKEKNKTIKKFLDDGVTAFLCSSDNIAYDFISKLEALGKKIPEDCSVIGFDDLPCSQSVGPGLTSIRQDRVSLGKSAFNLLEELTNGVAISKILLRPELVSRNSVRKIK